MGWRMILKWLLKNILRGFRPYSIGSDSGKVTSSCENGNEISDAIKDGGISTYFNDSSLLNMDPVPCFSNHFFVLSALVSAYSQL
jgi:hypothetical protein